MAPQSNRTTSNSLCGRVMVGSGGDTYDPICEMPQGHSGGCKSSAAVGHQQLAEGHYAIQAFNGQDLADWWCGYDEVLAQDAARELLARGHDRVEVFRGGEFLGRVERGDDRLPPQKAIETLLADQANALALEVDDE